MESPEILTNGDEPEPTPRDPHWVTALFSAEPLAVGSFAVAASTAGLGSFFGLFAFGSLLSSAEGDEHLWWQLLPILMSSGLAILLGLGGIRQAVRHGAARWVRALAGGGVFIAFVLLSINLTMWATRPG